MSTSSNQHEDQPDQTYNSNALTFESPNSLNGRFEMPHSGTGNLGFFSFDNTSDTNHSDTNGMSAYDLPMSPTMSGTDMFYNDRPTHIDPAATWSNAERANMSANVDMAASQSSHNLGKILTDYQGSTNTHFGQITPPSDNDLHGTGNSGKRADSGVGEDIHDSHVTGALSRSSSKPQPSKLRTMSGGERPSKRARKESVVSFDDDGMMGGQDGDKREKYREKNRVAAAKCRAKKKEHVDNLEDTHRTQSVLNTALKQTEKQLRDELSYWRTQALHHTFCDCGPIQEYNMRKAQNLAAESILGNPVGKMSPTSSSMTMASPMGQPRGIHPSRSQSVSVRSISSPVMENGTGRKSFATPSHFQSFQQAMGGPHDRKPLQMRSHALSQDAEQELKDFVKDG